MATYNLAFPDVAIDAILTTAYHLQQVGYIFRGSASDYSGTPTEREWVIAPAGFTGLGLSSAVPQGSFGICLYNGTSWVGKIINVATIDSTPTQNSVNAVSSGGAYAAINQLSASVTEALENLTFTDTTPSAFQDEYINMKVSTTEGGVERILTYLTILAATTSKAGLMSAEDKAKVDSFLTNLRSLTFADTTASADQGTKITETLKATIGGVQEVIDSITLLAATSSKAGLLSASDKAYIDALPATLTSLSNSISGALALMQSLVGYYICDTAAGTAAKTVAATGYSLTNGGCIRIKMNNANTAANVTLNINSTGAKALYYDGAQASSTNTWEAGEVLEVYYDGTQYQCASGGGGKFASGEKVKEVSITNTISSGSSALPTSGAVAGETDNLNANIGYFTCDTVAATAAKVVAATGYKLTNGGSIRIKMTNSNTAANATLNINGAGAKALFYNGVQASSSNSWDAGDVLEVYYDGVQYQCVSGGKTDKTFLKEGMAADSAEVGKKIYLDYDVLYTRLSFNNWMNGITVPMSAGTKYVLTWENNATIYFRVYDENNTSTMVISARPVTGPYVFEYTPTFDIQKFDIYSNVSNNFTLKTKNTQREIVRISDIVNDVKQGGASVPLSAECGKVLDSKVGVFDYASVCLSYGTFNTGNGYHTDSYVLAYARIPNVNISQIFIKDGYHFKLYGKPDGMYTNTNNMTGLVTSFTTDPYQVTSNAAYLWILVEKTDQSVINADELFDIVRIEKASSLHNFKTLNNVYDYYKCGTQEDLPLTWISGEGIGANGDITTGSSYARTENIDVTKYDALRFRISTTYNDVRFTSIISIRWLDENGNAVNYGRFFGRTTIDHIIVGIPDGVKYATLSATGSPSSIIGIKKNGNLAGGFYREAQRSCLGKLKKVTLVILDGQSLVLGSGSLSISAGQKYLPLKQLVETRPLIKSVTETDFKTINILLHNANYGGVSEYPAVGMGEQFVDAVARENNVGAYANEWENHWLLFNTVGQGETTIAVLSASGQYQYFESTITNVKRMCDACGYELDIPCWVWFQGEQDNKAGMSSADYKTALLALHEQVCASVANLAGITKRPKCIIYQPDTQCLWTQNYNFANPYLEFNNAYVELLRDNDEFLAAAPTYIFGPSPNNEGFIHLDAESYNLLGAYAGYAMKKYLIDGQKIAGVIPTDISVSGTTITIKFNVPSPPLQIDTTWVRSVPNYGFNVIDSNNNELISSVSVLWDTVTIECTSSPLGAKLRYGLNGDAYRYPNSNYSGADGRIHGGRGNIRDCQGNFVYKNIQGKKFPMHNWAYTFEKLLT